MVIDKEKNLYDENNINTNLEKWISTINQYEAFLVSKQKRTNKQWNTKMINLDIKMKA